MKNYVVIFEAVWENKCGTNAGWVSKRQRFDSLKRVREYAKLFTNLAIYRAEWTDGNGYQFVRKLKTI